MATAAKSHGRAYHVLEQKSRMFRTSASETVVCGLLSILLSFSLTRSHYVGT